MATSLPRLIELAVRERPNGHPFAHPPIDPASFAKTRNSETPNIEKSVRPREGRAIIVGSINALSRVYAIDLDFDGFYK